MAQIYHFPSVRSRVFSVIILFLKPLDYFLTFSGLRIFGKEIMKLFTANLLLPEENLVEND